MDHRKLITAERRERFMVPNYTGYTYFKTPDGEDLIKKLIFTSKFSLGFGSVLGLSNALGRSPIPKTHKERLVRVGMMVLPCLTMSAAYTIVTYYSTRLRQKDDELNHFFGGMVAGGVLGSAMKSVSIGIITGAIIGLIGAAVKTTQLSGVSPLPEKIVRRGYSSYYMRNADLTLTKDIYKGNWTKEPAEN